jgi:hypothetical protein
MGEAKQHRPLGDCGAIVVGGDGLVSNLCGVDIDEHKWRLSATDEVSTVTEWALDGPECRELSLAAYERQWDVAAAREAGVCLIAATLGFRPQSSQVRWHVQGWRGGTVADVGVWKIDRATPIEDDWRIAAVLIARHVAENVVAGRARRGAGIAEEAAHQVICDIIAEKLGSSLGMRAIDSISHKMTLAIIEDRRPTFERVRAALNERCVLNRQELHVLLMDAPDRSEAWTRQFLNNATAGGRS